MVQSALYEHSTIISVLEKGLRAQRKTISLPVSSQSHDSLSTYLIYISLKSISSQHAKSAWLAPL